MKKPQAQKKNEEKEPRTWSLKGFLQEIKRIDNDIEDRRFAFILGAGASINSNIKGAAALAKEWMEIIYHREHEPTSDYQNWLASNPLKLNDWEPNNLAKHYPQIFEKCFEGDHDSGYAALEKAIKDGKPSLGYAVLAWILSSTRHRMVVTTNFDNLVADAVSIYGGTYPHVIGHESLASYAKPLSRRPIVAKIHRDLFTDPINTCQGTGALEKSWVDTLKNIFRFYTPVFIGYGGNDGSLMDFLQGLDTKDISGQPFWCYYAPAGAPNNAIKQLMHKHNGVLVPSMGFDELMLQMGEVVGFDRHKQITEIKKKSEQLIVQIQEQMLSLSEETKDEEVKKILQPQNQERDNWNWLDWALKIDKTGDKEEKETLYKEAIEALPNSYQLLGNYANFLRKQRQLEKAEQYYLKAIETSPDQAGLLGNYASFLHKKGKLEESKKYYEHALSTIDKNPINSETYACVLGNYATLLKDMGLLKESNLLYLRAIEIAPNEPDYLGNYALLLEMQEQFEKAERYNLRAIELAPNDADFLGNYASLLHRQGRNEEAEHFFIRAVKAAPKNANNLGSYALLLHEKEKNEDAERYFRQAVEIEPDNAAILGNFAVHLNNQGKSEEAERFLVRAIKVAPKNANILGNYALLLYKQGKSEEAEQYYQQAIEAAPNHGHHLGNYANFLTDQGKLDEAEQYYRRAIEATPNHANNLGSYADYLKERERFEEANEVIQQALAIEPNNEHLLEIRAAIQSEFPHLEEETA